MKVTLHLYETNHRIDQVFWNIKTSLTGFRSCTGSIRTINVIEVFLRREYLKLQGTFRSVSIEVCLRIIISGIFIIVYGMSIAILENFIV